MLSRELGRSLGDRVNVHPVRGYSITVGLPPATDQAEVPWVSLLDDKAKIVISCLGPTRFQAVGITEFNKLNQDIRAESIKLLVNNAQCTFNTAKVKAVRFEPPTRAQFS